jgi:hypothetical protein
MHCIMSSWLPWVRRIVGSTAAPDAQTTSPLFCQRAPSTRWQVDMRPPPSLLPDVAARTIACVRRHAWADALDDGMRLMCSRRRTGGRSRPRKIALRGRPLGDRFGRTPSAGAPGDDDQCSSRAGRGSSAHAGRGSGARAAARAWARGPDGRKACVDLRLRVLRVTAPRRAHG